LNPLLIQIPDVLETPRLLLQAPRAGEAEEINQAVTESLNELRPWMPWANVEPTMESTRVYCQSAIARHASREEIAYRIRQRETELFLGTISLPRPDWSVARCEIGYWLRRSQARHGYMTEAVRALAAMALATIGIARLEIRCDEQNAASRCVAERAGFELEGIFRQFSRDTQGRLANMCVYSRCRMLETRN